MKTFVVSDLHCGDGGARDNFAQLGNDKQFNEFLDYVGDNQLIIAGDLFELWQGNFSKILTYNRPLMDRLGQKNVIYIIGNHDIDLKYFINTNQLSHPLFAKMQKAVRLDVGIKHTLIVHGHEADPFCCNEDPDFGRVTAIISGLLEDANSSKPNNPIVTEDRFIGGLEKFVKFYNLLTFKGSDDRLQELYDNYQQYLFDAGADCLICGHTHIPGRIDEWYYNAGSWARNQNTFLEISDILDVSIFEWANGPKSIDPILA
jgi:UDP-2,3-diacylglucosamine pyrophosphatase LpxH